MNDPTKATVVAARRWFFEQDGQRRWWYTLTLEGARGARYEVEVVVPPGGGRPIPFAVKRSGYTTRTMRRGDLANGLQEVARAAVAEMAAAS